MPHFDNDPSESGSFVRRNSRHLNVVIYVFHAILAGGLAESALEVHMQLFNECGRTSTAHKSDAVLRDSAP